MVEEPGVDVKPYGICVIDSHKMDVGLPRTDVEKEKAKLEEEEHVLDEEAMCDYPNDEELLRNC